MKFKHNPVLLTECIEYMNIGPRGVYVDGTLGGGGHSQAILEALNGSGLLVAIDRDEAAIRHCEDKFSGYGNIHFIRDNYLNISAIMKEQGIRSIDGMLLDLGVSSYQLDEPSRGFSYMQDAPLDMRMDNRQQLTAYLVVNEYEESEIATILKYYGEERYARKIAAEIVSKRQCHPIETTLELVDLIKGVLPKKALAEKQHPAKRTFQAIRIEVNAELAELKQGLVQMVESLADGGRLLVITFHSLEDRIVKQLFRELADPCTCPKDFPICVCGKQSLGSVVTRKPVCPSALEVSENHRARSAKLRVFQKGSL